MRWYPNTDTVDISARSIGIHLLNGPDNRGLCIQIRHNGERDLLKKATEMANLITALLNEQGENNK